ncbi:Glutamine amidotransferase, class I [hydrothermal vent metagenome]|uniref:Glutamine amidotransferase, class I n=1 Tax=hydrothermal vent metagenome TaxID=652676 RepID=A0A3B0WYF0_9ZZZZ
MRAHYLQHVPFEGLGSIEPWLQNVGYEISSTQFFNSENLPEIEDIDLLVVMGGPMSVNDESEYSWLVTEKKFIKSVVEAGKPVLGICLGAQLIANSMGGKVSPNLVKEIGWFPIEAVISESNSVFQFPKEVEVFHWHGETFSLPKGAVQIAKSKGCKNQAFQIGRNVIGLQFHLETTPISAQAIVENCRDELVKGEYIQSEKNILSTPQERYSSINSLMENILEYLQTNNG